ncbi:MULTISPECIES: RimK family protein [Legionella]|uniref:ATP-grasp domain-containing protein n=1 Tax=Legionella septentrionalis TaxID=2498109 RepID=A0A3S0WRG4_9GAMM|nr:MULTISPECIES: RimK family protein [Legionella]MCP0913861.1 RimK family protein [Legionella sp. 27cVA30]RUQ85271.1 ATP-grasp domain-containing protein [Legionella septentrionalis]RUQ98704.1 ATP-grasp domain-containing protein [Legionella septentrionalis]RUR09923.1 ATP-grasp domain-containing protein [Legionella septentrionalis]RUR14997.1 ATP-grasp domain-containing protein [Legionella septentrionalis]
MQTILVTDNVQSWEFLSHLAPVVHAFDYLSNENYHQSKSMRIINLCQSYNYQTIGYYVSLLAHARDHKAIPSVLSIQDVLNASLSKQISQEIDEEIQHSLHDIKGNEFVLSLYFGQNMAKRHAVLAKKLHGLFPLPLLRFTLEKKKHWSIKKLQTLSLGDIPAHHDEFMRQAAESYFSKKRFHQWRKKQRFHDLAILIDAQEPNPPSNKKALDSFVNAGEEMGLNIDFIDKNDSRSIAEYDALFIRATTAVDHYTYRFARRAAQENIVVIDDPQSIVKCTNKVYLAELLQSHQILTPETLFISKYDTALPDIKFPCVLKKPDSAFSHGVIKLDDEKDLQKSLAQFFKTSDLILIQPFIPTDFDWRIGVLDNKPLYACRYFMAKNHWQIYNWDSKFEREGRCESVPLSQVPEAIIKTALKATRLIGDSLYGVDIKSHGDKHYVIEVNDNPNIDFGIEDEILGETLYQQIMGIFLQRIRRKHGYV